VIKFGLVDEHLPKTSAFRIKTDGDTALYRIRHRAGLRQGDNVRDKARVVTGERSEHLAPRHGVDKTTLVVWLRRETQRNFGEKTVKK
jgi:hypothetical protein